MLKIASDLCLPTAVPAQNQDLGKPLSPEIVPTMLKRIPAEVAVLIRYRAEVLMASSYGTSHPNFVRCQSRLCQRIVIRRGKPRKL